MAKDSVEFAITGTNKRIGVSKVPRRKSYCFYDIEIGKDGVDTMTPLAWIKGRESAEKVVAWLYILLEGKIQVKEAK